MVLDFHNLNQQRIGSLANSHLTSSDRISVGVQSSSIIIIIGHELRSIIRTKL